MAKERFTCGVSGLLGLLLFVAVWIYIGRKRYHNPELSEADVARPRGMYRARQSRAWRIWALCAAIFVAVLVILNLVRALSH